MRRVAGHRAGCRLGSRPRPEARTPRDALGAVSTCPRPCELVAGPHPEVSAPSRGVAVGTASRGDGGALADDSAAPVPRVGGWGTVPAPRSPGRGRAGGSPEPRCALVPPTWPASGVRSPRKRDRVPGGYGLRRRRAPSCGVLPRPPGCPSCCFRGGGEGVLSKLSGVRGGAERFRHWKK